MKSVTEKLNFIRSVFGEFTLSRNERDAAVKCPSCTSVRGKRKLSIRIDDDYYHCWVCGIKGRNLVPLLKSLGRSDALDFYKKNFLGKDSTVESEEVVRVAILPNDFQVMFLALNNFNNPDFAACYNYLKKRGISDRDIWYYKLGVSCRPGFMRRIIFPSFDSEGKLNFIVSRAIDNHAFPKYLNCNVDRNEIIFNELFIDWKEPITIVEGPFDLIKAGKNAIPLLGSGLANSSTLFQALVKNKCDVYLSLDSDAKIKTSRIAMRLSQYGCSTNIVPLGDFSDVGEMSPNQFQQQKMLASKWSQWGHVLEKIDRLH